ncbi:C-terminal binding protein [Alkalibacter saccharofermentans]|uniref:D-3-phosphoglycerate dehydrogenase n=1 Tax=Alkalibacter saccharofermentans DSM 14828 TaxID=1120975 RepID=A0A1M4WHQ2_9FIRM|nr:C-terminal binding protein [Alkalibacter saccharofermentans]SHE80756.1 D-3-phosphoglycerate dehydrogenase [Alkalibacter saccharofermentans DSM 14828]
MVGKKVVITDYQYENVDNERKIVEEAGFALEVYNSKEKSDVISAVREADAVIVQYADIDEEVISHMEKCKVIIKYGIGFNNIDTKAASQKGIYVCNVPDYGIDEVANHAIAMIMALAKKLITIDGALKKGDWSYDSIIPLYRMAGSTLGLVGLGRIPMSVAKKMKGFDMEILAYDPFVDKKLAEENGVKLVDFDTLCTKSDFISVHCPLNDDTLHLFNKDVFDKMKETAYIINTARGPVINEADLIEALKAKKIAGAGLDVFEVEPITKDNELLNLDNVIATPHIAWYSEQAINSVQSKAAIEAVNVISGNKPLNPVNSF